MEAPVHRTLAVAKEPEGWARGVAAVPEDGGRGGGGGREGGRIWREFCLRNGRCMSRAGIGRRMSGGTGGTGSGRAGGREGGVGWGSQYTLSVEIFDRKGGFRLFCSYGQMSVMQQGVGSEGQWLTKLAVTGFASCWHFSAATRDPVYGACMSSLPPSLPPSFSFRSQRRGIYLALLHHLTSPLPSFPSFLTQAVSPPSRSTSSVPTSQV